MDLKFVATGLAMAVLALGSGVTFADAQGHNESSYCMDVEIEPFHMLPGPLLEPGACPVRDYLDGELQAMFYPFTIEEHRLNCESADFLTLPVVGMVVGAALEGSFSGGIPSKMIVIADGDFPVNGRVESM